MGSYVGMDGDNDFKDDLWSLGSMLDNNWMVGWLICCGLIGYCITNVRSSTKPPPLVRVVTADHLDEADADAEELPPPPVAAASMPSGLKEMPALRSTTPPVMDASNEAMKRSVTRVRLTT